MKNIKGIQLFPKFVINLYHKIHYVFDRSFTKDLNPLVNIGAIANITFIIAVLTGVLLLFWYAPSVHVAHNSVVNMMTNMGWYAGIIRSLHRYSSDACVLAMCLHIIDIIVLKKYDRPRWPAWVTGIFLFIVVWFEGWIGYWLVWDEGAKYIAVATAKLMDVMPIFAEPMSRSFLTKDSINSLFFFVVFFGHMLIPLLVAILLWLHISRLSKPKLFTKKPLTIYVILSLLIISIIQPAPYGELADVQRLESTFPLDYFFVFPLYIVNYFSPVTTWLIFLISILLLISIPFLKRSKKEFSSSIIEDNCHACRACFNDCPFNAISMISIGKNEKNNDIIKANVDSELCVQCGICVGSCSTDAIAFPLIQKIDVETKLDHWLHDSINPFKGIVTFICQDAIDPSVRIDEISGECSDLLGHKVIAVPCSGWINVDILQKLNQEKSVKNINVVHCSSTTSYSRLGSEWAKNRIEGHRYPNLKFQKIRFKKLSNMNFILSNGKMV
jgi:quinol-cytochrome oxidoreductase complex cytochrome b subunit